MLQLICMLEAKMVPVRTCASVIAKLPCMLQVIWMLEAKMVPVRTCASEGMHHCSSIVSCSRDRLNKGWPSTRDTHLCVDLLLEVCWLGICILHWLLQSIWHCGGVCSWLSIRNGLLNHRGGVGCGHWGRISCGRWGCICGGHWGCICHRWGSHHGVRRHECRSSRKWRENWQQGFHLQRRLCSRCWCWCRLLLLFGCPLFGLLGRGCCNANAAEQQTNQKNPCNDRHAEPSRARSSRT